MSASIFLVVLALTSQFSKCSLLQLNFRQHGTDDALSDLPDEDDNDEFELYFTFTKFVVDSKNELELEEKTSEVDWEDAQAMSINLEVYQIYVDHETDPFGFLKEKKGGMGYHNMDMKALCKMINQSLKGWKVHNDYVYGLTIEKEDRAKFKVVIETFTAESVTNMTEMSDITAYEFKEEMLILL